MTNAPKRIWATEGSYPYFADGDWDNASASASNEFGPQDIRADLHADLLRAADELADEFEWFMDHVEEHYGVNMQSTQDALDAYRKAKEKTK